MNELTAMKTNGSIESREVAEMVGKEHSKLLRDIRGYADTLREANIGLSDFFIESEYLSDQNKKQPCFLLTKQGCEMVANKLTGKKGTIFTAKYVQKFNAMQKVSSYMIDDPIERAKKWIEEEQQRQLLITDNAIKEQLIAEYEPKITYLDEILNSKNTLTITQIAADYGMSAVKLNRILFDKDVQRKVGKQWILYTKHMNKGYTLSETYKDETGSYIHTKWSQKGRLFIHNLLESLGHAALADEQLDLSI